MQVEMSGGELGEFGETTGEGQACDRMSAQIFQRRSDKIAHINQRMIGEAVKMLNRLLRGSTCRGSNVTEAGSTSDIDPAMDGMDPGSAGIGDNDARRAKDRQPSDDTQPRVHGFFGEPFTAGDRNRDGHIGRRGAVLARRLTQEVSDHRARRRIDRRLADRQLQPGTGYRADTFACDKADPRARLSPGDFGDDEGAMSDIGIVACILDNTGAGPSCPALRERERKTCYAAARQMDRDPVGKATNHPPAKCCTGSPTGPGAGRPTSAQRRPPFAYHMTILAKRAVMTT